MSFTFTFSPDVGTNTVSNTEAITSCKNVFVQLFCKFSSYVSSAEIIWNYAKVNLLTSS